MTVIPGLWVVALMNGGKSEGASMPRSRGDNADFGPGAQWETPGLCDKLQKARHVLVFVDGARRSGLGAAAWVLWVRDETGSFEKVSHQWLCAGTTRRWW